MSGDEISKRAKITESPPFAEIQARLDRDGEVFLRAEKAAVNFFRLVIVEPEQMRALIGGLK
jgi:hypothetical protein